MVPCDVSSDEEIDQAFATIKSAIHVWISIFIPLLPKKPSNQILFKPMRGFPVAHDVSSYSLVALSRAAAPMMTQGEVFWPCLTTVLKKWFHTHTTKVKASAGSTARYLAYDLGPKKSESTASVLA